MPNIEELAVNVPDSGIKKLQLVIIGDTPLLMNRFAGEALDKIRAKEQGLALNTNDDKEPEELFRARQYIHPEGGLGFPAIGFKKAAVRGAKATKLSMTDARGGFFINGQTPDEGKALMRIFSRDPESPHMREDRVVVGRGSTTLRYRPEVRDWWAILDVEYNSNLINHNQLFNIINHGGFGTGVGDWRPEKDGQYGRFHIADEEEIEELDL